MLDETGLNRRGQTICRALDVGRVLVYDVAGDHGIAASIIFIDQ